jgi:hypothetical protein
MKNADSNRFKTVKTDSNGVKIGVNGMAYNFSDSCRAEVKHPLFFFCIEKHAHTRSVS